MNDEIKKKCANHFAAAFAKCVGESLAAVTGTPWPLEVMSSMDAAANGGTQVHYRLSVEGAIKGECFAEFYEAQVSALIAKAAAPVEGAEQEEEPGDALARFISSAMEGLSGCVAAKFGAVTVKVERVAGLAFGGMFVVPLAVSSDPASLQVLLYFGSPLLEALSASEGAGENCDSKAPTILPKNLKLVMDVELNVALRFGQRQMPLREVLELASGSVIELDRLVDEPVELLLDGKLIARGEAVVVDGNYGLRITEIPQPVVSHFVN